MAIPFPQKPYNAHPAEDAFDLPTTTFGPLDKYVAANDNEPGIGHNGGPPLDDFPDLTEADWQRHAAETRFSFQQAVPYLGDIPGENKRCKGWSGAFNGDNPHMEKTPEERLSGALGMLANIPGYIYLGSPYSKYEAGHDVAARVAADAAARLMQFGMVVYSPIAHGHAVATHGLPLSWDVWKRQCQPMIDASAGLVVLTMHGWSESVGLQYEIDEFVRAGKPILHVSPAWLVENEVGRAAA